MPEPIKVAELPEFDAAASLSDARVAAAYQADIAPAENEGLLSAGLADIERAGVLAEVARAAGVAPKALGELLQRHRPQRAQTLKRLQSDAGLRARYTANSRPGGPRAARPPHGSAQALKSPLECDTHYARRHRRA